MKPRSTVKRGLIPYGLALLACLLVIPPLSASATPPAADDTEEAFRLGIIIDETISAFGHEYARQLSAKWLLEGRELRSALVIRERPSALKGSLIEVHYESKTIFAKRYPVRRADIEKFTSEVLPLLQQKILEAQLSVINSSPDLAGSGL